MNLFKRVIIFFVAFCWKVLTLNTENLVLEKEGIYKNENSGEFLQENSSLDPREISNSSNDQILKITSKYEMKSSLYSKVNKNKL